MYFKDAHVVSNAPEINQLNGKCSGKAKIKLRCQNGLRSDALLKSLYQKGAKFKVQNHMKQGDMLTRIKSANQKNNRNE